MFITTSNKNQSPIQIPVSLTVDHHLNSPIQLVLHTMRAQSLFNGSWSYQKMGLLQFSKLLYPLWKAAKEDDPYAEWHLMKIYDQIGALKEALNTLEVLCQEKVKQLRGFEIQVLTNPNPVKIPLTFSTPFSYMAAYLVADIDYLLRLSDTLKQFGIFLKADQKPSVLMGKIRALFWQPTQWKYTGVTRQDIRNKNKKAEQAKNAMGEIPRTILNKTIYFAFLPKRS